MGKDLPTDADAPSNGGERIEPPTSRRRGTVQQTFVEKVQNARVIIDYKDANKTETQRTVDVKNFDFYVNRDGTTIIVDLNTYCELRNAPRKFNYRRIIEASDAETGETIPNLGAWLWARRV
ncbi:DNA-binding transcriptional regulator YafY [Komagataeibacter phage phiKM1]|nr:DNA-binding transcriptional regulator YafY [Komagataeibacter phage phiKM1]